MLTRYSNNQRLRVTRLHWVPDFNHQRLMEVTIIVGVLLLCVLLPSEISPRMQMLISALCMSIGGLIVLLRWPALGSIALITAMLIPYRGPSGLSPTMILLALLFGVWLVEMLSGRRKTYMVPSVTLQPLIAFVLVSTLALGLGQLNWYMFAQSASLGAQLGGWAIFVLSAGAFLWVGNRVQSIRWLQTMTWVFLSIAALFILLRLTQQWRLIRMLYPDGATGSLFWTWLTALAFSQALFNRDLSKPWRLLLACLVAATLYVGYVQSGGWKSGWIPPVITVLATLGVYYWRFALSLLPWVAVPGVGLAGYLIATDEYSWGTRVDAWLIVAEITKASPILGLGFGNYRWFAPLFPIRGYAVQFNSHSQYVDIASQTGVVGLICFLWLFATIAWLGWRLRLRVDGGFPRAYVYGALGGLVGTLVAGALGDWVLPFFYNINLGGFRASILGWLFLGGLVVLERIYMTDDSHSAINQSARDASKASG